MIYRCKYFLLLVDGIFIAFFSYSQDWIRQPSKTKKDSLFAVYVWEEHDHHAAGGEIILLKNGRFFYSSFFPLGFEEHAGGTYWIDKDMLTLTSDLQSDNLKIEISYVDSIGSNSLYSRLRFPVNKNGNTLYNAYYFINNDTSFNGHYDPLLPFNIDPLTTVKNLKLMFYETKIVSAWLPIAHPEKHFKVTVLTDVNADDRTYKILKEWKFKMIGNKLIEL